MTTELDLDVSQATFGMGGSQCTDAVNQEAIACDWRLESLFSTPCHADIRLNKLFEGFDSRIDSHFWMTILVLQTKANESS